MGIGIGIFMFVAGAILRFALNVDVPWINLYVVGNILMVAGVLAMIGSLIMNGQSRKTTVRQVYDNRAQPQYDPRYDQQGGQAPTNYGGHDQSQGGYRQPRPGNDQTRYDDQGY